MECGQFEAMGFPSHHGTISIGGLNMLQDVNETKFIFSIESFSLSINFISINSLSFFLLTLFLLIFFLLTPSLLTLSLN